MKTIIAGSRTIHDLALVEQAITASGLTITQVVSGCAPGVDRLGEQWGYRQHIPIARFPADWNRYGPQAGPMRNGEMATYAEQLLAIWDGVSRGTKDMIAQAQRAGLVVVIYHAANGKQNGIEYDDCDVSGGRKICTKCYATEANTRSPLQLCRSCYQALGSHGRHDLTWLRSLSADWRRSISNARLQALVEETPGWPLYRGPVSGYGVAHWGRPKR